MFDVVIPTKNRPEDLHRLLDSIRASTVYPKRIVIIDQSEEKQTINPPNYNDTIEIVHIHDTAVSGLTAAKNLGISKCKSDIVFFFDDDIILDPDFFEIIMNHFKENPKIVGICGRQKNSKSSKFKLLAFNIFHFGEFKDERKKYNSGLAKPGLYRTSILPGGITAYKRKLFTEYHFDEVLVKYCLGEDMDLSYRVGKKYKLAFATDATALHNHSQIGRYDPIESYACKVASYTYFYKKNVKKNAFNSFSYFMVILGIVADALAYSVKNKNLDAIRGLKKGKRYVKTDFRETPFIDYERLTSTRKK